MVPRRPHEGERDLFLLDRQLDCLYRCPRREQGDLGRFGRGERIGVQHRGLAGDARQSVEVFVVVNERQLIAGGEAGDEHAAAALAPDARYRRHDVRALGALGMAGRRHMLFESRIAEDDH